MSDKPRRSVPGDEFEDGNRLKDWTRIESPPWHWQYDTHELAFHPPAPSHSPLTVLESSNASRTCSMVYSPRFRVMFSRPSQWS